MLAGLLRRRVIVLIALGVGISGAGLVTGHVTTALTHGWMVAAGERGPERGPMHPLTQPSTSSTSTTVRMTTSGGLASAPPAVATAALPGALLPTIETCLRSPGRPAAVRGQDCAAWAPSGPVDVIIVSHTATPLALLPATGPWHAASGNWLVARGATSGRVAACPAATIFSAEQVELRINRVTRRHFKAMHAPCSLRGGLHVTFGEAHTDLYDLATCGGDHMIDLDVARDALVDGLRSIAGATVVYVQNNRPGQLYPSGCGPAVTSDGRVAIVTLPQ